MFKILSMALISLVGMQYANTSGNNIQLSANSTPVVNGGTPYDEINSGFYLPTINDEFTYGPVTVDYAPYSINTKWYSCSFRFTVDYMYYKMYQSNVENMVDTRDLNLDVDYYLFAISYTQNQQFTWFIDYMKDGVQLRRDLIAYYSYNSQTDETGFDLWENTLDHRVFYVSNFQIIRTGFDRTFRWTNGGNQQAHTSIDTPYKGLPLKIDNRYRSLERNYYFPYQPVVYGYWYKDQNSTYYIPTLGTVGTYSRPTIFKGYFKCNGENFRSYLLDGINSEQPSNITGTHGYFFGPFNNVSSISNAIKPASGTQFWFASDGLFEYFNNGVKPVWYTRTTPVVSSNVEYNVISNTYQWYSFFYQNIYLVYEEIDTSGNLTAISDMSYYDMLSFNTGFISTETDINPLTNALTLVGVAFQQLWSIGNIVLFGTITINSLILLPILVSLVLFVIHLIKRG